MRTLTFKIIDALHQRPEGTAKRNFSENRERFINGQDYFCLTGDELKGFKQSTKFVPCSQVVTSIVGSNAKELILITMFGYLMLTKSMNDDLGWHVQRQLVNNYFNTRFNEARQILEINKTPVKEITQQRNPIVHSYLQAIEQALQSGECYLKQKNRKQYIPLNGITLGTYDEFCYYLIASRAFEIYSKSASNPCGVKTLYALMRSEGIIKTYRDVRQAFR